MGGGLGRGGECCHRMIVSVGGSRIIVCEPIAFPSNISNSGGACR